MMRASNTQINLNDERQKEYQRQQERLKAMASSADKVKSVSADIMIENLLKDSFKKTSKTQPPVERQDNQNLELPHWLQSDSTSVPPQYKYLWSLVQLTVDLADTQKVSQLLLTSGLHVDVLGFIWNLANKVVPGQLTKQEFYIVLALVGLAQAGSTFNNLSVLKILSAPSIPVLKVGLVKIQPQTQSTLSPTSQPTVSSTTDFDSFQNYPVQGNLNSTNEKTQIPNTANESLNDDEFKMKKEKSDTNLIYENIEVVKSVKNFQIEITKGPYRNSNFPCIGSSPTAELEDDFTEFQSVPVDESKVHGKTNSDFVDEFTEFQSANIDHLDAFETVVITQKREIPKIPLPKSLTGKLTSLKSNLLKISPESERRLKVLSQAESLSSLPESKISSSNKVSTSISVLGSNHGIGSRLANHSLSAKLDRPKHHKHHKIKINPSQPPASSNQEEEIILGVKPTNIENLIPKCCPKKPVKTFILKETKIKNEESLVKEQTDPPAVCSGENTRQIEIPMVGTFNETVLPTQSKPSVSDVDLISVQEDKYSALREIELELNKDSASSLVVEEENDDFGDFLSADIPPPLFSTIPSNDTATSVVSSVFEPFSEPVSSSAFDSDLVSTSLLESISTPAPVPTFELNADFSFQTTESVSVPVSIPIFDSTSVPPSNETFHSVTPPIESIPVANSDLTNEQISFSFLDDEDKEEGWGDWNFSVELSPNPVNIPEVSDANTGNKPLTIKLEPDTINSFSLLTLDEIDKAGNGALPPPPQTLFGQIEPLNILETSPKSETLGFFDAEQNDQLSGLSLQPKLGQSNNEFWDFVASSDQKPQTGITFSRHGSLPSLDLKMSPADEMDQEIVRRKCLESCHNLIREGFEIFNNINIKSVLDEVFAAPKTSDYLNYLNIAYQISKRINQSSNDFSLNLEDLEREWKRLEELCFEYNIKLRKSEDNALEGKSQCSICHGYVSQDSIIQGTHSYHPSCANLWINFIEESLPYSA